MAIFVCTWNCSVTNGALNSRKQKQKNSWIFFILCEKLGENFNRRKVTWNSVQVVVNFFFSLINSNSPFCRDRAVGIFLWGRRKFFQKKKTKQNKKLIGSRVRRLFMYTQTNKNWLPTKKKEKWSHNRICLFFVFHVLWEKKILLKIFFFFFCNFVFVS